jgi:hypothetical protein
VNDTRAYWVDVLERVAHPVLSALAEGRLRSSMPIEAHPTAKNPEDCTYLEAFGRTLVGIAPWLELGADDTPEGAKRAHYGELARAALVQGTNPNSPDWLRFGETQQSVVDMGFLAQALLRAPNALWEPLTTEQKQRVVDALLTTRARKPGFNNWLLFSGIVEAALRKLGHPCDTMRLDYALRQHEQWYVGDGAYSDGPRFHWDYYNSFVIQPMLVDIYLSLGEGSEWEAFRIPTLTRSRRYAEVQERLISPEGTFPPIGRSLAYRFGALQTLAQTALLRDLPEGVSPASVRCALTAVIRRMIEPPGTFDENGWLRIGFCGAQPGIGETYISTGSLYLCSVGLLPLGLPADNPFWSVPDDAWTAKRLWDGEDLPADHAIRD